MIIKGKSCIGTLQHGFVYNMVAPPGPPKLWNNGGAVYFKLFLRILNNRLFVKCSNWFYKSAQSSQMWSCNNVTIRGAAQAILQMYVKKNLGGICGCPVGALWVPCGCYFPQLGTGWSSAGDLQGIWGWPADASPRNSDCFVVKISQASTGYLQGICRASGGGLQMPLKDWSCKIIKN